MIDLTDDSEMATSQQPDSLQYNTSGNELQFLNHLFVDTTAQWVDNMPHDIEGLKLYRIKCSPQEWAEKSQDERYFKMHSLRRKDLIGTRKVESALEICIALMMIAHLNFLQKEKGTLPTFSMWMDTRCVSAVEM